MTRREAREYLYAYAQDSWLAACAVAGVNSPAFRYQGGDSDQPAQGAWWARASIVTLDEQQETLRLRKRRFLTEAVLSVQLFAPRTANAGQLLLDEIASDVRNAFRVPCPVEHLDFTAAAIDDNMAPEPSWLAATVAARYTYREFL